jgi:hypothetical protein
VRVLLTPAHASWLNQAELLLRAFTCRYLDRGDWKSRQNLIDHLDASWREYNHMFAHPILWSWTRHDLKLNVQRPVGVKKGVYNIIALMKSRQKIVEFKYMYRY